MVGGGVGGGVDAGGGADWRGVVAAGGVVTGGADVGAGVVLVGAVDGVAVLRLMEMLGSRGLLSYGAGGTLSARGSGAGGG